MSTRIYRLDQAPSPWRGWVQDAAALATMVAFAWVALSWSAIAQAVLAG